MENKNWKKTTLDDVCTEITSGGAAPQGDIFFDGGNFPFIRVADMGKLKKSDKFITATKDKLNSEGIKNLRRFPTGTVIFTKSGASLLLNQRAIIKEPSYVVSHIGCMLPNEKVTSDWLYYFMKMVDFNCYAHATTLPSLKLSTLKEISIPVPPLSEQERIVSRIEELFSSLDNAVETLQKTKEQLAVYRQAVLKEVLESHGSCNSILGEVILSLQNGIAKRKGADGKNMIVLRLANVDNEKILDSSEMRSIILTDNEQKSYLLNEGDGLIVRVNGSIDRVGRMVIVSINGKYAFCDHLIRCVFNKDKIIPRFAKYLLDDAVSRKHIKDNVVSTAGQNTISQGTIKSCPIYLPSLEEQRVMIQEIESRLSICGSIEQTVDTALAQAEALRQSILKEAFEGRL